MRTDDETSAAVEVTEAIAAAMDTDPSKLSPPVDDVVDTDALETLFSDRDDGRPRGRGIVLFRYKHLTVTVDDEGYVTVGNGLRGGTSTQDPAETAQ